MPLTERRLTPRPWQVVIRLGPIQPGAVRGERPFRTPPAVPVSAAHGGSTRCSTLRDAEAPDEPSTEPRGHWVRAPRAAESALFSHFSGLCRDPRAGDRLTLAEELRARRTTCAAGRGARWLRRQPQAERVPLDDAGHATACNVPILASAALM